MGSFPSGFAQRIGEQILAATHRARPFVAERVPSGVSTPSAPSATAAAVEVRNTVGPSRTATAPASVNAVSFIRRDATLRTDHQHQRICLRHSDI